ncbi:MAG: carboxypeptidase-like regulatory domain-containing protein [bacterium]
MRGFVAIFVLGCALVSQGCGSRFEDFQVPAQDYGKAWELGGQPTGTLLGRLVFPSEYAQRSATLILAGRTFTSHPDGRFRIENVPAGRRELVVTAKGYESLARSVEIKPGDEVLVEGLRLRLARGIVFGRLVKEKGGSAPAVELKLYPSGGAAVTDNDGIFQFIGVNSGRHTLRISDAKFFTFDRRVSVHSGERQNLGNIKIFRRTDSPVKQTARLNQQ